MEGAALYFSQMCFLGARLVVGAHGFSANKTRWYIRTRNLISSTIQWLNSALHSTYLVKKYIYRCEGDDVKNNHTSCNKRRAKEGSTPPRPCSWFMAHGEEILVAAKTSERRGLCGNVNVMAHEQRNIAQSQIHLPFTFRVRRAKGGRGARRGWGRSRESSIGLNFNSTRWYVLDPTRLFFPFTKSGKAKEAASEFPKGARKSTFWIPVKETPLYITANQHRPAQHEGWMVSGLETVFCWVPVPLTNHGG